MWMPARSCRGSGGKFVGLYMLMGQYDMASSWTPPMMRRSPAQPRSVHERCYAHRKRSAPLRRRNTARSFPASKKLRKKHPVEGVPVWAFSPGSVFSTRGNARNMNFRSLALVVTSGESKFVEGLKSLREN